MGPPSEKLNVFTDKIKILNNLCSILLFKMFVVFEIYEVKDRPALAPKIPYYKFLIIYDPNFIKNR